MGLCQCCSLGLQILFPSKCVLTHLMQWWKAHHSSIISMRSLTTKVWLTFCLDCCYQRFNNFPLAFHSQMIPIISTPNLMQHAARNIEKNVCAAGHLHSPLVFRTNDSVVENLQNKHKLEMYFIGSQTWGGYSTIAHDWESKVWWDGQSPPWPPHCLPSATGVQQHPGLHFANLSALR